MAPRLAWMCSEDEGLEGFCIHARRDITIREREDLLEAHGAIAEYEVAYLRQDRGERDGEDTPRRREMTLLAPWVTDWNAVGLDAEGNEIPLPPPAIAGPDAFMGIDNRAYDWIVKHLLLGYRASGKAGGWEGR
jgi:hypothetical protein